jgi:glucose-6-phosphate 1-dehydrogenase
MEPTQVPENVVRGQYARGFVRGDEVPGYREEPDVLATRASRRTSRCASSSTTGAGAASRSTCAPASGSRRRVTEIAVQFKKVPHGLFRAPDGGITPNVLAMRIQPDEGIALRFISKEPGQQTILRDVAMDFRYGAVFGSNTPEAYERLLLDAMRGEATLFTRRDEVEEQWAYIDHVFEAWAREGNTPPPLYPRDRGGPSRPTICSRATGGGGGSRE